MTHLYIYNALVILGIIGAIIATKYADREINRIMDRGDEDANSPRKFKSNNRKNK